MESFLIAAALARLVAAVVAEGDVVGGIGEGHLGSGAVQEPRPRPPGWSRPHTDPVLAQPEEVTALGPGVLIGGAERGIQIEGSPAGPASPGPQAL